mmetsp:Transcript_4466/g.8498  ORF Transcript_4466/g.8498 Transcript_4466/m.8498 type:complete len:236 (+) Transcript_4466:94-801(+)
MMTSATNHRHNFNDSSTDMYPSQQHPEDDGSPSLIRKKLQLKPRSNRQIVPDVVPYPVSSSSPNQQTKKTKPNPFGAAKPRELILQQRGVDVQTLDAKFELKAAHYERTTGSNNGWTPAQRANVEAVRRDLERLELQWRDANEKELPEETYRLAVKAKRDELHTLLQQLSESAAADNKTKKTPQGRPQGGQRSGKSRLGEEERGKGEEQGFTTVVGTNNNNKGRNTRKPPQPHGW